MTPQACSIEKLTGASLFLVALALYACTGSPYPVPGESAWLVAAHTELTGAAPLLNPVWGQVARAISWIPIGPLAFRLNLFSALCGAGAVWVLYLILRRLPVKKQIQDACPQVQTVIGLCGALYLMVSLPLWHASTRAHYDSFDLLLFLASVYFLQSHLRQPGPIPACLFAFLYGLGLVESPIFVIWAPFLAAAFGVFLWVNAHLRLKPLAAAVLGFVCMKVHLPLRFMTNLFPTLPWANASRRIRPLLAVAVVSFLRANAHLRVRLLTFMTLALLLGLSDCLLVVRHYLHPPIAALFAMTEVLPT